ncbi:MAG TPA: UDP-N-acetylmuramoyl-tripeptide--D-alanyl-D-alanine ligase [Microscillaceae bacterium]|jgi:UDP-N-acetylmuramoyl-tripeptide--D-alanyl-D-alanine ligase|nr:UDP-N-acetylmuramoyl-tripeptide--D-alanyl-D-alanine ligase [Microscillaceae bacterium]
MQPIALEQLYTIFLSCPTGVCTDTRKIQPGCLFIALKGANFNGNRFATQALEQGAAFVLVDEVVDIAPQHHDQVLYTPDCLHTLQDLARLHRTKFTIPVIAIGGSNGKTTTKELTARVLSKRYKTYFTPGNLNNHIGVPLTLLAMPLDTEMAVVELGANHEQETWDLCQIALPNYGVVTNIGLDHLEGFGSLEGVARANAELYQFLAMHHHLAFVNENEEALVEMAQNILHHYIPYRVDINPTRHSFFSLQAQASPLFVRFTTDTKQTIDTQLYGQYNLHNIATALCIGRFFKVAEADALAAVASYTPANMRSQLVQMGSNTVILDAYNANPSSMEQALHSFARIDAPHKVVILGDMLEMGDMSIQEHQKLGTITRELGFETVLFYGQAIQEALSTHPKAYYFPDKFSLHNWLQDRQFQHTHFLIKGSRGVALETVLPFLDTSNA